MKLTASILAFLMWASIDPVPAFANCTREAIMRPDGTIVVCLRCCGNYGCNTFCE